MLDDEKKWQQPDAQGSDPAREDRQPAPSADADDPLMTLPEIIVDSDEGDGNDFETKTGFTFSSNGRRHGGRGRDWKRVAAAVALVALGAGVGSATTWALTSRQQETEKRPIGVTEAYSGVTQTISATSDVNSVIPAIYKKVAPSVVILNVTTGSGWVRGTSQGSGFVVDERGYILTNYHVIEDARTIQVKFLDGTILAGEVVGSDPYQDLAVVKVDPGDRTLVAASLGDSDSVQVGELAIAIGSPFGQEFSVTAGIVSAVDREVREANNPFAIAGAIQTDAAINPGNSGGPLLNASGEVIGINTLIETGDSGIEANVGIGFAIPINAAKEALPALMNGEKIQHPWLGVSMVDLTAGLTRQLGTSVTQGAVVMDVYDGSPADQAGLQAAGYNRRGTLLSADIIVQVDDQTVTSADDVVNYVRKKSVGDTITLKVVRGKQTLTLTATLAARPDDLID